MPALQKALEADWRIQLPLTEMLEKEPNITDEDLRERVVAAARQNYTAKVEQVGTESWSQFERSIMLQAIDTHWREHLSSLDYLRQGIHLRGYAEEPQAGIQARSLRAVLRHAGPHPRRCGAGADDGAGAVAGAG